MLPGVEADVNALSYVDPDHLMCFGIMKHLVQALVASISTQMLRKQLTHFVKELVWPSGTPNLYNRWSASGASKFGKGTLSMRGYEQLFLALVMRSESFLSPAFYAHLVHVWQFHSEFVVGGSLSDEQCARARGAAKELVAEGKVCALECWDVPNGHAFINMVSRMPLIRNLSLTATGSLERMHSIKRIANIGSRSFENSVMEKLALKRGVSHFLSGGTFGNGRQASPELLEFAASGHPLLSSLTFRSLKKPVANPITHFMGSKLAYCGSYEPAEAGATAHTWTLAELKGLRLWALDKEEGLTVRSDGYLVNGLSYCDPLNGKLSQLRVGDDVCILWPFEIGNPQPEYARVDKIAVVLAERELDVIACVLVFPIWWKQMGKKDDRREHPLRKTAMVRLDSKNNNRIKWASAEDILDTVMVVHSCGVKCRPDFVTGETHHDGPDWEVWDRGNCLRLPTVDAE